MAAEDCSAKGLISIIVPVYCVEAYIERCVESILAQTYEHLEIILIDDGSPDNSPGICDEMAKRDDRIVVIHQKHCGVSAARNAGLDVARGEYFGFVDSDDYIDRTMYETLLKNIEAENSDISICGFWFCYADDRRERAYDGDIIVTHGNDEAIASVLTGQYYAGHLWTKLFRRTAVSTLRFNPDVHVYEDMLFVVRVLINAKCIVFDSTPLYYYGIREESLYNKPINDSQMTALASCDEMVCWLLPGKPELVRYVRINGLRYCLDLLNKLQNGSMIEKTAYGLTIRSFMRRNINVASVVGLRRLKQQMAVLIAAINVQAYYKINAYVRRKRYKIYKA